MVKQILFFVMLSEIVRAKDQQTIQLSIDVQEELPRTTIVADLTSLLFPLIPEMSNDVQFTVRFFEPNNLFYIDSTHAPRHLLRIQSRLDREADCTSGGQCCRPTLSQTAHLNLASEQCTMLLLLLTELKESVLNRSKSRQLLVHLKVNVLDINDHAPSWTPQTFHTIGIRYLNHTLNFDVPLPQTVSVIPRLDISLTEHTRIGTRIVLPMAHDPDSPPDNCTQTYGIVRQTTNDAFLLEWNNPFGDRPLNTEEQGLHLVVNKDLNHDEVSEYYLVLYASDGGMAKVLTGYLLVNISVLDINDHPPKFIKPVDNIWVMEHVELGLRLYELRATDEDSSDKNRLTFGFLPSTIVTSRTLFELDSRTGVITVRGLIDFEERPIHRLFCFVSDGKWTDQLELNVFVLNDNDHPPVIQMHSHLATTHTEPISYGHQGLNSVRPHLTVIVKENGPPDQLIATVTVVDEDLLAEIRAIKLFADLKISTTLEKLDDVGRLPVTPQCILDHPLLKIEPLTLSEPNGVGHKARFKIHLNHQPLDREKESRMTVRVICHDRSPISKYKTGSGLPVLTSRYSTSLRSSFSHTATAVLRIIVSDDNDNPPVFIGSNQAKLSEAAPIESLVLKLKANDADDALTNAGNAGIRYRLLQPITYVLASNDGRSVSEGNSTRSKLPPQPWFDLNANTGELRSLVGIDRELLHFVTLNIEIRDGGDAQCDQETSEKTSICNHINCTITIEITDHNDCTPTFTQPLYEFNVSEDARPPLLIGKFNVTDCDAEEKNRRIVYSVRKNSHSTFDMGPQKDRDSLRGNALLSWFSVSSSGEFFFRNPQNGRQFLHRIPLDREENELIVLDVFAQDSGSPSLTGSAQVLLRILDVNDHAPEWKFPKLQNRVVNMSIDTAIGNRIAQLVATDPDEGPRGTVSYSILSGNEGGQFELDPVSGWIYLAQSIQKKYLSEYHIQTNPPSLITASVHRLYVQASDQGTPPRTSSSVLDIIVQRPNLPTRQPNGNFMSESTHSGIDHPTKSELYQPNDLNGPRRRAHLLPSDFLTLIAMITATLAALMLFFILFVIIRCQRMKSLPSNSEAQRHHPHDKLGDERGKDPNGQSGFNWLCPRWKLSKHEVNNREAQEPPMTECPNATSQRKDHVHYGDVSGCYGSSCSLSDYPMDHGTVIHGQAMDTVIYTSGNGPFYTTLRRQDNAKLQPRNYDLLVHIARSAEGNSVESMYPQVLLNNSSTPCTSSPCPLRKSTEMHLLPAAESNTRAFKIKTVQDDQEVEFKLDGVQGEGSPNSEYTPLKPILRGKVAGDKTCQSNSSFV